MVVHAFCSPQGRLDRLVAALTTIVVGGPPDSPAVVAAQEALDRDAELRRIDESGAGPMCTECGMRGCTPYGH